MVTFCTSMLALPHKGPDTGWVASATEMYSHSYEGQKPVIMMLAGLEPSESQDRICFMPLSYLLVVCLQSLSFFCLQTPKISTIIFTWHSPCVHVCLCSQISPSYKDISHVKIEFVLMTHLNLIICKDPLSKYSYIHVYQGLGLQYLCGGQNSTSNIF